MTIPLLPPGRSPPPRRPNAQAEAITGRGYVSFSQLSLMRACPRKFAYQYVENAPPDFQASSLLFGGAIHQALEFHFRAQMEGLKTTPEALLGVYHQAWQDGRDQVARDVPVRFNQREDQEKIDALADRMIRALLLSEVATPPGTILGIEEELRTVLDLGLPDLLSKVDLVYQDEHALHVVDFKTSRSRWNQQKAAESAEQLILYGQSVRAMSLCLGLPVRLHFIVLTKAVTPLVQVIDVPLDEGRLATMKENIAQVWTAIQAQNFYASPSPQACSTCPFKSRCPIFAGR